jgi:hypothetical protein
MMMNDDNVGKWSSRHSSSSLKYQRTNLYKVQRYGIVGRVKSKEPQTKCGEQLH